MGRLLAWRSRHEPDGLLPYDHGHTNRDMMMTRVIGLAIGRWWFVGLIRLDINPAGEVQGPRR